MKPSISEAVATRPRLRLFDVVVVEAIDRLGRRLSDVAALHDRLEFRRIAAARGQSRARSRPCMSACSAPWRSSTSSDLKDKTRRGQLGRVLQGRAAGGRAYGYRAVERGRPAGGGGSTRPRRPWSAAIFRLFADGGQPAGDRPAAQCRGRARAGRAALAGHDHPRPGRARHRHPQQRALCRPAGLEPLQLRQGPAHRPAAGPAEPARAMGAGRGSRAADRRGGALAGGEGPPAGAVVRGGARRGRQGAQPRPPPQFLLSGLLVCGVCGGGYTIMGKDRYGCAAHRSKGSCGNDRTIGRQAIEGRVLDGLKHRLLAPELFEAFARAYQEEWPPAGARGRGGSGPGSKAGWPRIERKIAGDRPGDRGRALPALDEGAHGGSWRPRRRSWRRELAAAPDTATRGAAPQPADALPPQGGGARGGCWPTRSWARRRWRRSVR